MVIFHSVELERLDGKGEKKLVIKFLHLFGSETKNEQSIKVDKPGASYDLLIWGSKLQ